VKELSRHFDKLRPIDGTRHGHPFVFKDLKKAEHVFLRYDEPKGMLQLPHYGPFTVVSRNYKNFTIRIRDKNTTVSTDRIKPAYLSDSFSDSFSDSLTDVWETTNNQQNQTDSTRRG